MHNKSQLLIVTALLLFACGPDASATEDESTTFAADTTNEAVAPQRDIQLPASQGATVNSSYRLKFIPCAFRDDCNQYRFILNVPRGVRRRVSLRFETANGEDQEFYHVITSDFLTDFTTVEPISRDLTNERLVVVVSHPGFHAGDKFITVRYRNEAVPTQPREPAYPEGI